ncbi:MAG: hypothetical protein EOO61_23090, partial [Hymenobacter sp.]
MREIISLVESSGSTFQLHPNCDPKQYRIGNSFYDISGWKAISQTGNSDSSTIGRWTPVGFVMIGIHNNYIIPISRGDEHHTGYDMLTELGIDDLDDYLPISNPQQMGPTYLFRMEDIPNMLVVMRKFLSYGGDPEDQIQPYYAIEKQFGSTTVGEFVKSNGHSEPVAEKPKTVKSDRMAPSGQKLYQALVTLADTIKDSRNQDMPGRRGKVWRAADQVARIVKVLSQIDPILQDEAQNLPGDIRTAKENDDLGSLEQLFFGFDSVK